MQENPKPRRRWFQFSLRTMLVLVTLVMTAFWLWARHHQFLRSANFHLKMTVPCHHDNVGSVTLEKIQHHHEMAAKYYEASRRPWLPVERDPPEPLKPATQD